MILLNKKMIKKMSIKTKFDWVTSFENKEKIFQVLKNTRSLESKTG